MKRLTKSQYEAIASCVHDQVLYYNSGWSINKNEQDFIRNNMRGMKIVAETMATRFAAQDSEFKKEEFLDLCGQAFWKSRSL